MAVGVWESVLTASSGHPSIYMKSILRSLPARLGISAFLVFLAFSLIARLLLLYAARHQVSGVFPVLGAFANGLLFDAAAATFAAMPWVLFGAVCPTRFITHRAGRITLLVLASVFIALLVFITTSEWVFWEEFGARFNFIAVDYLIWTQEVLGNISESYPMGSIGLGIAVATLAILWALVRAGLGRWILSGEGAWRSRIAAPLGSALLCFISVSGISQDREIEFNNQYLSELGKNGCWSFFAAFHRMELEYTKWYRTEPRVDCLREARALLATPDEPASSTDPEDFHRHLTGRGEERRWNVIVVCMESMSGDYMGYLGNKLNLTPNLDRLAGESLFFENLYATGTRTVRGMEALTLNLPPTPGQAIIYRPEGTHLRTTFSPFLDRGYDCAFFYGGDGRFDFMNRYFSTAGCRVMDLNAWKPEDVTMKTSWGACDEDLFHKTLAEADADHAAGKPFHYFCMTTSNHRPYDFPTGRIDLPPHGRFPAVKYADWAVGDLIKQASTRPWFDQTVFVIVSDHCASSAGKAEIDVSKYHIPAIVYAPALIKPQRLGKLSSQIDVMPTVFGLLQWNYDTLSYGHDLLAPHADAVPGRAFVSNYQKIGLLQDDQLAILKPNKLVSVHRCNPLTGEFLAADASPSLPLIHDATLYYQSASDLFDSGKLKQSPHPTVPPITRR